MNFVYFSFILGYKSGLMSVLVILENKTISFVTSICFHVYIVDFDEFWHSLRWNLGDSHRIFCIILEEEVMGEASEATG